MSIVKISTSKNRAFIVQRVLERGTIDWELLKALYDQEIVDTAKPSLA